MDGRRVVTVTVGVIAAATITAIAATAASWPAATVTPPVLRPPPAAPTSPADVTAATTSATATVATPVAPVERPGGADGMGGARKIEGDEAPGMVAFTFDDGPAAETTPAVLDALAAHDVPAAFFVVGRRLVGGLGGPGRALLERIVADGHLVGSHSISHIDLKQADAARVRREIDGASTIIAGVLGRPVTMFRPPFGAFGSTGTALLARRRLTDVRWSIDTKDWQERNPRALRALVMRKILAGGGGIVLMHDTKRQSAVAFAGILDDLEAENCRRLDAGKPTIVPVSLHYFARDRNGAREVPPEVAARTERYLEALPHRCRTRALE